MEDKSNKNNETPKESSEKIIDRTVEENQPEPEVQKKDIKEDKSPKKPKDETKEETKKPKKEEKKEKTKKKVDRGPDFKYIVRLSNTDVDGEKNVVYGLTSVKGIGVHIATLIADQAEIDRYKKIGYLSDSQIEKIQALIDSISNNTPSWMLNHQKDYDTGEDIHLVGSEIDMRLRDEINIMKKIRSYRGIRHERGLRVRGQRTRANNRRGLALGVSKKREPTK